jgi:ankyrin repeat protein
MVHRQQEDKMAALPYLQPLFSNKYWLATCRSVTLIASCFVLAAVSHAANPQDWWVNITNDRASQVKTMLAQGADPNELSPKGQPALMQAIRDGAWNVYDILVARRETALNAININRETALMYLAILGETKRAQDLIRRGAQVNRLGWTPLQYAASKGHLDTVRMLVANKALVNAPAPDGTTALMMAAYAGSEDVVRFLLKAGADPTMQNLHHRSAADWARVSKHGGLADALDAASERVLAQRAAVRQKNQAGTAGAPAGAPGGPSPGARPESAAGGGAADRPAASGTAPGGPDAGTAASGKPSAGSKSSTSRYFDLDRFEKSPNP